MHNTDKKLLIFDFDGTLIDSADDYLIAVNMIMKDYSWPELERQHIVQGLGHGLVAMMTKVFPKEELAKLDHAKFEGQFVDYYKKVAGLHTKMYEGAEDFLQSWSGKLAMVTNKSYEPTMKLIKHLKLDRFPWHSIYGFDSLPLAKPDPLPLNRCMQDAQVPVADTVMIGDGEPDLIAAQRAGVDSIAIGFGYGNLEILQKHQPSRILQSYKDLPKVLVSLNR